MKGPVITRDQIVPLLETRFLRVYDLQYAEGKHYYNATRRAAEDATSIRTDEEFRAMLPDAVTCVVVIRTPGLPDRLLLSYEYRYPAGRFLLSPTAGLIDPADRAEPEPLLSAARREIFEETGITLRDTDTLRVLSPLAFSSPGMTDESNALVLAVIALDDLSSLTQEGAEGTECFDGFELLTREQALPILRSGRDRHGNFYSIYTWAALACFCSGMYAEE